MACETIENTGLQSETIRDKLKAEVLAEVLALTDKQAEYILRRIQEWTK